MSETPQSAPAAPLQGSHYFLNYLTQNFELARVLTVIGVLVYYVMWVLSGFHITSFSPGDLLTFATGYGTMIGAMEGALFIKAKAGG